MKKLLWIGLSIGIVIAILPFLIGFVGLALDNAYLASYHWYTYFSVPVGIVISIATCVIAVVIYFKNRFRPY